MTINSTIQRSSKYSPHEILFGRPMSTPGFVISMPPIYPNKEASD